MSNALQTSQASQLATQNPFDVMFNDHAFERLEKVAALMASGRSTIPEHLRGNVGDCFAITMQAFRWGVDPYAAAQKTFNIKGVIGYEAQLVNAIIIKNAPITSRPQYEWFGAWEKIIGKFTERESKTKKDDNGYAKKYKVPAWQSKDEEGLGVRVWATIEGESEPRVLELLLSQALTRNSTLWAEDPKQQLAYLAIKRWARLHCPDVIMGVYTPDELMEEPQEIIVNETPMDSSGSPVDSKTADVINNLGKKDKKSESKPPIDSTAEPVPVLAEVMVAIAQINSNETKVAAKAMIDKMIEPDKGVAFNAYRSKIEEIKKQTTAPDLTDWESAIDACANADDLATLETGMPKYILDATEAYREKKMMSFPVAGEDDDFKME